MHAMARSLALAFVAAALAGCQTAGAQAPAGQDIAFARGCWVVKERPGGEARGFLRILPDRADPTIWRGVATTVDGGEDVSGDYFLFARDGSRLMMRLSPGGPFTELRRTRLPADRPRPPQGQRAVFGGQPRDDGSPPAFVAVEGNGERLHIYFASQSGEQLIDIIEVERDGCD
jgi:hypothetical protein